MVDVVQFYVDHATLVRRGEQMLPYAHPSVRRVAGDPNVNCAQISMFMVGLVNLQHVHDATENRLFTSLSEVASIVSCVLASTAGRPVHHTWWENDRMVNDSDALEILQEIGNFMDPGYATIVLLHDGVSPVSHVVVLYMSELDELKIIDRQTGEDENVEDYVAGKKIDSVIFMLSKDSAVVMKGHQPCPSGPMNLSGGRRRKTRRRH